MPIDYRPATLDTLHEKQKDRSLFSDMTNAPPSFIQPSLPNIFEDPYASIPITDKTRTTINVPDAVRARMSACYTRPGILQTTINILLHKLYDALDRRPDLAGYNPDGYVHAILYAHLHLGDGPGNEPSRFGSSVTGHPTCDRPLRPTEAASGDVRRGNLPVALPPAGHVEPPDPSGNGPGTGSGSGQKGKGGRRAKSSAK